MNRTKEKKHRTLSIEAENLLKLQRQFIMETVYKLGIEGYVPEFDKGIYKKKSNANIILNGEVLNDFPQRLRARQECQLCFYSIGY